MKDNGTLYYLSGDHLGSASLTTSSAGALLSTNGYYPFGASRFNSGIKPTDKDFTGQLLDGTGLHFYNARYYDSLIGRFISADTIVPEPGGSQGFNRYAYVNNNPVRYTDPSGHFPIIPFLVIVAFLLAADTAALPPPSNYPINYPGGVGCSYSLPDCFGDKVYLKDFSKNGEDNPIPIEEFEAFADKVAEDLLTHDLDWPGFEAKRHEYDTPFYNNGGSVDRGTEDPDGVYPSDQLVCIETIRCSGRSEINYLAQGMWGAAVGEPRIITNGIAIAWKAEEYQEPISGDALFWLNYRYDYYEDYYQDWLQETRK